MYYFITPSNYIIFIAFQTHHFVLGALSSRMTRDLLDKVNNPGGSSSFLSQHFLSQNDIEDDEDLSVFHYFLILCFKSSEI